MMTVRRRLSLAILLVSGVLMIAMTATRWIGDASFWADEAAIAYNAISMSPIELLGPLDTGHQFPRLYLAAINQLRFVFGYETMVMRALPFAFFVAGVVLWQRLLWLRFRSRPGVIALGVVLTLVPGDWFAYGAMFKQYSLDVFLALLPFTIADSQLDRRWRRGDGKLGLVLWCLPCLVSLSYGIALLGRLVGYALGTARASGPRLPLAPTALLAIGFGAAMACSYLVDLRHAFESATASRFWSGRGCVATGDPLSDAGLLGRWLVDWYVGLNPFGGNRPAPAAAVAVLQGATAVGAIRVLGAAWRGDVGLEASGPDAGRDVGAVDRAEWGTRGLSALATVGGLWAAGLLLAYPVCANRLTLFAFFSLVLIGLEGFALVCEWGERLLRSRWIELAPVIIAAFFLPSAASTVTTLLTRDAPSNVRSLLPIIATAPDRTVVVGRCSSRQVLTLPEWIERDDVEYADLRLRQGEQSLPRVDEFWLISTGGYAICPAWTRWVRERAEVFRMMSDPNMTARLFYVKMPPSDEADEGEEPEPERRMDAPRDAP